MRQRTQELALKALRFSDIERMAKGKQTKIKLWKNFTIGFEVELEIDQEVAARKELFGMEPAEDEDAYEERISEGFADQYFGPRDHSDARDIAKIFDDNIPEFRELDYLTPLRELAKAGVKFELAEGCRWGDPCYGLGTAGMVIFLIRSLMFRYARDKHSVPFGQLAALSKASLLGDDLREVFGKKTDDRKLNELLESFQERIAKFSLKLQPRLKAPDADVDLIMAITPHDIDEWMADIEKIKNELIVMAGNVPIGDYMDTPINKEFDNSKIPVCIISRQGKAYSLSGVVPFGALASLSKQYSQFMGVTPRLSDLWALRLMNSIADFLLLVKFTKGEDTAEYQDFQMYHNQTLGGDDDKLVVQVLEAIGTAHKNAVIIENKMLELENEAREEFESENPINMREVEIDNQRVIEHMRDCLDDHFLNEYIEDVKEDLSLKNGVEIITYPFGKAGNGKSMMNPRAAMKQALDFIEVLNIFLKKHPEFKTSSRTGFHINIGTFPHSIFKQTSTNPPHSSKMDLFKMILFLGERRALDMFNRLGNNAAYPIIGQMARNEDFVKLMVGDSLSEGFSKFRRKLQTLIYRDQREKHRTINFIKLDRGEYLEFRFAGNEGYNDPKKVVVALRMIIFAVAASLNPNLFKNEYMKKLSVMVENYRNDTRSSPRLDEALKKAGMFDNGEFKGSLEINYRKDRPSLLLDVLPYLIFKAAKLEDMQEYSIIRKKAEFEKANPGDRRRSTELILMATSPDEEILKIAREAADKVREVVEQLFPLSARVAAFRSEMKYFVKYGKPAMALMKRAFLKGD
jgi:hypothetical protein